MRALVTGAGGFIGSHVVRALRARGHEVRALLAPGERSTNLDGLDGVELVRGDVTLSGDMRRAVHRCDAVFHLAAIYALWMREPERMWRVNVEGTRNVLRAAREAGVRRVVHTSSIARFGGQGRDRRATEESAFRLGLTGDAYSISKNAAHEVAVEAARAQDVVMVAPCGPLGPGDVGPTPTGRLLLSCLSLPVVPVTRTVTNFAHVRDMAEAHVLAFERGVRGRSYLLGHRDLSLAELARLALAAVGVSRPVIEVPASLGSIAAHAAELAAEHVTRRAPPLTPAAVRIAEVGLAADAGRAVRELGMPQTPIEDALREALVWWAEHGYVRDRSIRRRVLS